MGVSDSLSPTPACLPPSLCLSLSPSLCSCVSPDVHEWRSMQLEETLPVPAGLHRAALPVSPPPDTASPGSARQQAARLPHISEARRPQTRGAVSHRAHPADANALNFHPALDTSGAPLVWRYLPFNPKGFVTLGWIEWRGKYIRMSSFFSPFSVQINLRVHHTPDTHVVIQPLDPSDIKPPHKTGQRPIPSRHKPKGRCFQETTPKQAVSADALKKKWRTIPWKKNKQCLSCHFLLIMFLRLVSL